MRGVTLDLGGEERRLTYDLNAIAEIGERLDITIRLAHFEEDLLGVRLKPKAIRTLLWAGLIHDNPDLTEEEVGGWVTQDNFMEVITAFFGLFGEMSPETKGAIAEMVGVPLGDLEPPTPMTGDGVAESAIVETTSSAT